MTSLAIRAEGLGKKYRIRHEQRQRYTSLRDVLTERARRLFTAPAFQDSSSSEDFWALRDVSFEVEYGEVVGIIGHNGAGKSTLLKILSRITEPSEGRVGIHGRVGSLLEVGTGFHPELTGRENIFLNGAILGMTRAEIKARFDEIVAFAEVEKFIDTPVKRYSTGMHVRLAFAVAAHLEPDVLVVDEVLAVGDAEFQRKCLGKMEDVSREAGRTILFVSHNMATVQALCKRSLLLDAGRVVFDGPTREAAALRMSQSEFASTYRRQPKPDGSPTLTAGSVALDGGAIVLDLEVTSQSAPNCTLAIRLHDGLGTSIACSFVRLSPSESGLPLTKGRSALRCVIQAPPLAVGRYAVTLELNIPWVTVLDRAERILQFDVNHGNLRQEWNNGCFDLPASLTAVPLPDDGVVRSAPGTADPGRMGPTPDSLPR